MATAPSVARAGPSIAGCVFHVIAVSLQLQLVMAWMLPPVTLFALVAVDTWSFRWAEETGRVPTPLTLTRRKVRCTPVVPGLAATPLSMERRGLVPKLVVGRADGRTASATTVRAAAAPGDSVVVV